MGKMIATIAAIGFTVFQPELAIITVPGLFALWSDPTPTKAKKKS